MDPARARPPARTPELLGTSTLGVHRGMLRPSCNLRMVALGPRVRLIHAEYGSKSIVMARSCPDACATLWRAAFASLMSGDCKDVHRGKVRPPRHHNGPRPHSSHPEASTTHAHFVAAPSYTVLAPTGCASVVVRPWDMDAGACVESAALRCGRRWAHDVKPPCLHGTL